MKRRTVATNASWERAIDLSPDGRRIAFVRAGAPKVVVVDIEGKAESPVAEGDHPSWSPDGKRLAYDREGSIYVTELETRGERKIVNGGGPSWSR